MKQENIIKFLESFVNDAQFMSNVLKTPGDWESNKWLIRLEEAELILSEFKARFVPEHEYLLEQ